VSRLQWQRFQLSCVSRFSRLYRWICLVSGLSVPRQVIPHPTAACLCVCIAVLRCTFIFSSFGCGHLCHSNTRCMPSSNTRTLTLTHSTNTSLGFLLASASASSRWGLMCMRMSVGSSRVFYFLFLVQ